MIQQAGILKRVDSDKGLRWPFLVEDPVSFQLGIFSEKKMLLGGGIVEQIRLNARKQPIFNFKEILRTMASRLRLLGESDVAETGRRVLD